MTSPIGNGVEKKLEALQEIFKSQLPSKISEIEKNLDSFIQYGNLDSLASLRQMTHSLAGSGGTFGAMLVSSIARQLELIFKSFDENNGQYQDGLSLSISTQLKESFSQLKISADAWKPTGIPYVKPTPLRVVRDNNLIFLAEDDELLAASLAEKLAQAGYCVRHYSELCEFEKACHKELPAAMIMDIVFKEGDVAGVEVINRLKEKFSGFPPVIFISIRDGMVPRLAAARAGACRYFRKPVDITKLTQTLDSLTSKVEFEPYRVLLVDDDEILLAYYSEVLRQAGVEVLSLSDPMSCLSKLEGFNPDIIVMDVYMPQCSGPELAQVIRQDDTWSLTPIMFLSTETDVHSQLEAMHLGGDDFLVKPVDVSHLVSAVFARAKRARRSARLNDDLVNTLRESEFQLIAMSQHNIVSVSDTDGIITSVNDKFCEVSEYSRDELLGSAHSILKSGYHSEAYYKNLWKMISAGKIWRGKMCNKNKKGGEYWVDSTIVPFLDEAGKPYKYVSVRTDITELHVSQERMEMSQLYADVGSWEWDILSDVFILMDPVKKIHGLPVKLTPITSEDFRAVIHPEDLDGIDRALKSCFEDGKQYQVNYRVVWPDESIHWVQARGNVIRSNTDEPIKLLGIAQDITRRKEAERGLIEAREYAEKANSAKSVFLSRMSHEFRTPLNAIMGFGQLLLMEKVNSLGSGQKESVDEIMKASSHLLGLINEVLDLSAIESGSITFSPESVDVGELILDVTQLLMPLAKQRGIAINLQLDDITAWVDRVRLRQVLLNLLSNAIKYNAENGAIKVTCFSTDCSQLRVSVTDAGRGISALKQAQLFKAFERLGVEEIEGTGIGLVITKNIIELMGGDIGVKSAEGEGATFWFEIPNIRAKNNESAQLAEIDAIEAKNYQGSDFGVQYNILHIEDNLANLRLIDQIFERREDVNLISVEDPLRGLALIEELRPNLILLDINLPGINGFEVLRRLRLTSFGENLPVVALTANAMGREVAMGNKAGFDAYITKPINVAQMMEAIDEILFNSRKN